MRGAKSMCNTKEWCCCLLFAIAALGLLVLDLDCLLGNHLCSFLSATPIAFRFSCAALVEES